MHGVAVCVVEPQVEREGEVERELDTDGLTLGDCDTEAHDETEAQGVTLALPLTEAEEELHCEDDAL